MRHLISSAGLCILVGAAVVASQDTAASNQIREQALEEFPYTAPPSEEKPVQPAWDPASGEVVKLPTVYVVEDPERRARLIAAALAERKKTGQKSARAADMDENLRLDVLSSPEIKSSSSGPVFTVSLVRLSW